MKDLPTRLYEMGWFDYATSVEAGRYTVEKLLRDLKKSLAWRKGRTRERALADAACLGRGYRRQDERQERLITDLQAL